MKIPANYFALEKILALQFHSSPVEIKYYQANALPSELVGPGKCYIINLKKNSSIEIASKFGSLTSCVNTNKLSH